MVSDSPFETWVKRHQNQNNRRLHFIGWLIALLIVIQALFTFEIGNIFYAGLFIMGFTFCGHYFCEGDQMNLADPSCSLKCHLKFCEMIVKKEI